VFKFTKTVSLSPDYLTQVVTIKIEPRSGDIFVEGWKHGCSEPRGGGIILLKMSPLRGSGILNLLFVYHNVTATRFDFDGHNLSYLKLV
jgi:hypothetical protein